MEINKRLPFKRCRELVIRIQNGESPEEVRRRAWIAKEWLDANEVISNEQYDDLMMAVSYIVRESYR